MLRKLNTIFRKQNKDASEVKAEPTLTFRSAWAGKFQHVAVLADGKHLVAVPRFIQRENDLQIWNIKTQQCVYSIALNWDISAIYPLENNERRKGFHLVQLQIH